MLPEREKITGLLHMHIKDARVLCHVYATEEVMKVLARRLGEDETIWAAAALLHDLDIEIQGFDFSRHGHVTKEILTEAGFEPDFIETAVMHNEAAWGGRPRTNRFQWALAAGDRITWLIYAVMRSLPGKSLAGVTPGLVLARYLEPDFAPSVDRPTIMECIHLGFSLEEFVTICTNAMVKCHSLC